MSAFPASPPIPVPAHGGDPHMERSQDCMSLLGLPYLSLPQSSPTVHLGQSVAGRCEGRLLWSAGLQPILDGPSNHEPGPVTACYAALPPEGERSPAGPVGGPFKEETAPGALLCIESGAPEELAPPVWGCPWVQVHPSHPLWGPRPGLPCLPHALPTQIKNI